MLAQSALTPPEVTQVQKLLGDFLRFMQKNHATFFVQEYEDEEPVRFVFQLRAIAWSPHAGIFFLLFVLEARTQ